jgi:predicted metal-dependent HD superfamily phosphohydrolase
MFRCRHRPLVLPGALAAELAMAYAEPHRAYHTVAHVDEVLDWYDRVGDDVGWQAPAEVYVAIVFHDAVYVPGASDNEVRSAAWARSAGLPVDGNRVAQLVELTARHGRLTPADVDPEAALFLDCDMAILGAAPELFDEYDAAIAHELAHHMAPEAYRTGRRTFLAGLLASPRIFLSDYFHAKLDAPARANLARVLTP